MHLPGLPICEGSEPHPSSVEEPPSGPRLAAELCPEMHGVSPKRDACLPHLRIQQMGRIARV